MTVAPQRRATWHDAFDAQMALWRWYRTEAGYRWLASSLRANTKGHSDHYKELLLRLYDAEGGRLIDCDPIYVSEEMSEVVEAARSSFMPEPLLETDIMTPRGFLWWAKPMMMFDRFDLPLSVRAVSWSREYKTENEEMSDAVWAEINSDERYEANGPRIKASEMQDFIDRGWIQAAGISITLYADRDHYLIQTQKHRKDDNTEAPASIFEDTKPVPVVPFHLTPWHFGQEFHGNEVDEHDVVTGALDWWTTIQTTFRLMQQRIAAKHFHRPDRAARREDKKMGMDEEREIVVVRLRREAGEPGEPSGEPGNYSHRWINSGHWRNQPYPKEGIYRQIWISPYVKGPKDKPLIVRPRRVFQWER